MAASTIPSCFKAYDIRGKVPDQLSADLALKIGRVFAQTYRPAAVALGHDIRLSSPELTGAVAQGLCEMGVDVLHLGLCGTEEVYHAAFSMVDQGIDGGIMVTASHNPADYNGMKFVTRGARPVTGANGLFRMGQLIGSDRVPEPVDRRGGQRRQPDKTAYLDHLLGYVAEARLRPLKLVVNSGNGCAGPIIDLLEPHLPFSFIRLHHQPDGSFPNGVPNPLLPDNREETAVAVREHRADLGIAWDGDFDRCFFWDEKGRFVDGYYLVGLLALEMLHQEPGGTILHDPRLVWNTRELVEDAGGRPLVTETGHALIKERMWREGSVYGGEMSAHHYFRSFGCCDSGMIPWLLVCALLSRTGKTLSALVGERMERYPISGEINSLVDDPDLAIERIREHFPGGEVDTIDGLSVAFVDFRFNVRKSNTEPLLRLNVETRADRALLEEKTNELLTLIRG
ncbi:phosphomannomutase [Desulfofustis glycolicus]|uniref:Phosphomannomutase n=1 Tax=Desulfofustis glycolicus DSM 9705 TaxID=1121409 RepID=A0A1M5S7S6_9BACT|nr:phosphomannomutase [Desulfofustis glycolicus]MCB2216222.1 phosphomannomutase [Desulfobulbaceae bacterium]SHH34505.1 phosphomannomutase [Desulfofustis glycolicus DSM 9705]